MSSRLDERPSPDSIDLTIHKESTVALNLMPKTLQISKAQPTPSFKDMIETLSKENGYLRHDLAYVQRLQELGEELQQEVDYVYDRLKTAVITFQKSQKDIESEFGRLEG